jgi:hypothetical protein
MTYVDALSELEDVDEAAPWCDLVFDIIEHGIFEQNADGGTVTWIKGRALANLRGEVIGFGFEIPSTHGTQAETKNQANLDSIGAKSILQLSARRPISS